MDKKFLAIVLTGIVAILLLYFLASSGTSNGNDSNGSGDMNKPVATKVLLETSMGKITIQLFEEKAPTTTANFKKLVQQ